MTKEKWRIVKKYPQYKVSSLAKVKRIETGKLVTHMIINGYAHVRLHNGKDKKRYRVHRLVAEVFLINNDLINKTQVNHIDGNKLNNHLSNLEYVTPTQNMTHAVNEGLLVKKCKRVGQYNLENELIKEHISIESASKDSGLLANFINRACNPNCVNKTAGGFIWKYLDETLNKEVVDNLPDMKVIPNYSDYKVTKDGRVYGCKRKIFLGLHDDGGYLRAYIYKDGKQKIFRVHRLVAEIYIPNPENKDFVNHKNKDKQDNRVENLEWVTNTENVNHALGKVNYIKA